MYKDTIFWLFRKQNSNGQKHPLTQKLEKEYIRLKPEMRCRDYEAAKNIIKNVESNPDKICYLGVENTSVNEEPLINEINRLTQNGKNHISFIIFDINKFFAVSYNSDSLFKWQSTIKAPYVGAFVDDDNSRLATYNQEIYKTLNHSNNSTYAKLVSIAKSRPLCVWLKELGVDTTPFKRAYPESSARNLLLLWLKLSKFINESKEKTDFGKFLIDGSSSATSYRFLGKYFVLSKAGWESHLEGDECVDSCNDAGIIFSKPGPYLFAILTDLEYSYGEKVPLLDLVEEINKLHQAICEANS